MSRTHKHIPFEVAEVRVSPKYRTVFGGRELWAPGYRHILYSYFPRSPYDNAESKRLRRVNRHLEHMLIQQMLTGTVDPDDATFPTLRTMPDWW